MNHDSRDFIPEKNAYVEVIGVSEREKTLSADFNAKLAALVGHEAGVRTLLVRVLELQQRERHWLVDIQRGGGPGRRRLAGLQSELRRLRSDLRNSWDVIIAIADELRGLHDRLFNYRQRYPVGPVCQVCNSRIRLTVTFMILILYSYFSSAERRPKPMKISVTSACACCWRHASEMPLG